MSSGDRSNMSGCGWMFKNASKTAVQLDMILQSLRLYLCNILIPSYKRFGTSCDILLRLLSHPHNVVAIRSIHITRLARFVSLVRVQLIIFCCPGQAILGWVFSGCILYRLVFYVWDCFNSCQVNMLPIFYYLFAVVIVLIP